MAKVTMQDKLLKRIQHACGTARRDGRAAKHILADDTASLIKDLLHAGSLLKVGKPRIVTK